ncbi:MAG: hypothetical protein ACAI34_07095 [Verrucomicrobium sp.]
MKEAAINFLQLKVHNMIDSVYWAIVFAWLGLVCMSLLSIWGRASSGVVKLIWSAIILFLPLVGLYIYLFYCLFAADFSAFERFGFFRKRLQD